MPLDAFRGGNPLERIVGYASLCPAPRDAFRQESGTGVLRQFDSEQSTIRMVRDPRGIWLPKLDAFKTLVS